MVRFFRRLLVSVLLMMFLMQPASAALLSKSIELQVPEKIVDSSTSWIDFALTVELEKSEGATSGAAPRSVTGGGGTSGQPGTKSQTTFAAPKFPESDLRSGALTYSYPFTLPAGRRGLQPDVALNYTSQDTSESSIVGYGWSLSIPSISLMNKTGVNKMYTTPVYQSMMDGELVDLGGGTFGAKVENGAFLQYTFVNGGWVVKDKYGVTYRFGTTAASRQDDPTNAAKVFAWILDSVTDGNGNTVTYTYDKISGAIYPKQISYAVFTVDFVREVRPDVFKSSRTGFTVVTGERIREVRILSEGAARRKYVLNYATGSSGSRSLLSSIVETGVSATGVSLSLPPTVFTYSPKVGAWNESSTAMLSDVQFSDYYYGRDLGVRMADVNGDGWLDAIQSYDEGSSGAEKAVWLHNGTTWMKEGVGSTWALPSNFFFIKHYDGSDMGGRVADVNGDGRADLFISHDDGGQGDKRVYLNTGTGWSLSTSWTVPVFFTRYNNAAQGVRIADVNGDGLADLVKATRYEKHLYANTGSGWVEDTTWDFGGAEFIDNTERELGTELIDIDGDGLPDVVQNYMVPNTNSGQRVWRNTGKGFVEDPSWILPDLYFATYFDATDRGGRMGDLTGDGLPEMFAHTFFGYNGDGTPNVDKRVYRNTGTGFVLDSSIVLPEQYLFNNQNMRDLGSRVTDVNGDGTSDIVASLRMNTQNPDGTWQAEQVVFNHGVDASGLGRPDVLTRILYPAGGSAEAAYAPTTFGSNAGLPMIMDTVSQVRIADGFGATYTTSYHYEGGVWYAVGTDRKFAGFREVIKTLPDGGVVKTYSHQGNGDSTATGEVGDHVDKMGRVYRVEELNGSGAVMRLTSSTWVRTALSGGRGFVAETEKVVKGFDGNADFRTVTTTTSYDTAGNVAMKREQGDVSTDDRTTTMTYAISGAGVITGFVASETLLNGAGDVLRETRNYYDGAAFGVVGVPGNATKVEKRKNAGSGSSAFVVSSTTYSSSGLPLTQTDERGFVTTMTYDAAGMYPASVTNALGHVETSTYDLVSGEVVLRTDANGKQHKITLDPFGRVFEVREPDPVSGVLTLVKRMMYTDTAGAVASVSSEFLTDLVTRDIYAYQDGLGRVIQTRKEMETPTAFATVDTAYDYAGRVISESLPYSSVGFARTPMTTATGILMTNTYDVLGRVTSHANVFGVSTTAYDQWVTTMTDAMGHVKRLQHDTFGQLIRVEEVADAGATYVTQYQFDVAGSLIGMIDANGNTRTFTYDLLGRRIGATDLHGAGDATFGSWVYAYDDAGNVVSTTDPNDVVVTRAFDVLGRVISEDASNVVGVETTYSYDGCQNGKGLLCGSVSSGVTMGRGYDAAGNVVSEVKTIDGVQYATRSTFDRVGNVVLIMTPDGAETRYVYDSRIGLLEKVEVRERTETPWTVVVASVEYAPTDAASVERYGADGEHVQTYSFDKTKMYRLGRKETAARMMVGGVLSSVVVQKVEYTYDAVGNVTRVVDTSASPGSGAGSGVAAKTVEYSYDALGRLTSEAVSNVSAGAVALGAGPVTRTWVYDAIGNVVNGPEGAYVYDGGIGVGSGAAGFANPQAATQIGSVPIAYDKNGNVVSVGASGAQGSATYSYDYAGKMVGSVVQGGGSGAMTTSTNVFDASGERVKNVVVVEGAAPVVTVSPNSMYSIVLASGSTPAVRTKHVMVGDRSIATITAQNGYGSAGLVRYVRAADHLGSASVMFGLADGIVAEVVDYYAFGTLRIDDRAGVFTEKRKFVGKEFDEETGLSLLGARFYEAKFGRFAAIDPVFLAMGDASAVKSLTGQDMVSVLADPQGLHGYAYARNNPMKYVDPDGEWFDIAIDLGFVAASAYALGKAIKNRDGIGSAIANLGLDVGGVLVPGVVGLGTVRRVATKADDVVKTAKVGLRAGKESFEVAQKIANGHAYKKHVLGIGNRNGKEYGNLFKNREQFSEYVNNVISNPSELKFLSNNRTGYWDDNLGSVVIHDPKHPDLGTVFRPTEGKKFFDELK